MPSHRTSRRAPIALALALASFVAAVGACASTDDALVAANRPERPPATTATTDPPTDATDTTDDSSPTTDDASATTDAATTATPATTADSNGSSAGTIEWSPCPDNGDIECGSLDVPLDYENPGGDTITLQLQRALATDPGERIGSFLFNPGGPGVSTIELAYVSFLPLVFDSAIAERFDIVGWDARGTGSSEPVDCVEDLDPFIGALDPTPDDEAEQQALDQASVDLGAACQERNGDLLAHISTQDTARDMDAIRQALGEEQISYFGFSYGSELGATYATIFPKSVRAMVIDGAANPVADFAQDAKETAVGVERSLDRVLAACADDDECAFYSDGDPVAAYDALFAELDANPLPAPDGRPAIGQGVMAWATIWSLYDTTRWESFYEALAAAREGDGELLLAAADDYWFRSQDGTWPNTFEALTAINCVDGPAPPDEAALQALADEVIVLAPRTGPWWAEQSRCDGFPIVEPIEITGAGAGPILVLGNAGDPVTPIESTEAMARALEGGRLITFEGEGHTVYIEAILADSTCVVEAVSAYLVDLEVPGEDLVCE